MDINTQFCKLGFGRPVEDHKKPSAAPASDKRGFNVAFAGNPGPKFTQGVNGAGWVPFAGNQPAGTYMTPVSVAPSSQNNLYNTPDRSNSQGKRFSVIA